MSSINSTIETENNIDEIWKDVPGFFGYRVSNFGRLLTFRNTPAGRFLPGHINQRGYRTTSLWRNSRRIHVQMHRLVALAFIPNPEDKPQVNHKDGVKDNNHVDNLEWTTPQENMSHAAENNLTSKGEDRPQAILTEADVIDIKKRILQKERLKDIAQDYNITDRQITAIKLGETWSHVMGDIDLSDINNKQGSMNHQSKLTEADVVDIKNRLLREESLEDIANIYNVTKEAIGLIKSGKNWSNVGPDTSHLMGNGKGEKNGNSKLTEKDVIEIKKRLRDKGNATALAREYGVSRISINNIKYGKTWSHVTI